MATQLVLLGRGNTLTIAAGTEETGGAFTLLDYELAPEHSDLPLHIHHLEDEAVYVLEGHLLVTVGEMQRHLGPGDFILLPREVKHAQRNPGPLPARFLTWLIPAGLERCFLKLEALLEGGAPFTAEAVTPLLASYNVQVATAQTL
jgi:quercetin dioxygenase-like cupin family protein